MLFSVLWLLILSLVVVGCGEEMPLTKEKIGSSPQKNYVFKQLLYDNDYELSSNHHIEGVYHNGKKAFKLSTEKQYSDAFKVIAKEVNISSQNELRISFWAFKEAMYNQLEQIGTLVISQERAGQNILWESLDLAKVIENQELEILGNWVNFEYSQLLEDVQPDDFLSIYIWNPKGEPLYCDDLSIELWQHPDSVVSPIPENHQKASTIYSNNFDNATDFYIVNQHSLSGKQAYRLSTEQQFGPSLKGTLADFSITGGDYLKVSAAIYRTEGYIGAASNSYLIMTLDSLSLEQPFFRYSKPLEPCISLNSTEEQKRKNWQKLSYWIAIPKNSSPQQTLNMYLWRPNNALGNNLFIDDFEVELWK